jgi:hypothetical protein
MPRILYLTTFGWLILAVGSLDAQQRATTVGRRTAEPAVAVVARAAPAGLAPARILPGTRPDVFSTIQGNALTSTNAFLPNANVRLRDARLGQIVEARMTDQAGIFTFRAVDPGSYIVEIIGPDRASVLGASQVLYLGPGEVVSAVVKLPFRVPPLAGVLGNTVPSAAAVATQAAASGVLAAQISGAPTCPGPTN